MVCSTIVQKQNWKNPSYGVAVSSIHYIVLKTNSDFYVGVLVKVHGHESCMDLRFLVLGNAAHFSTKQSTELV
jgi:uncharacterized protein YukJ